MPYLKSTLAREEASFKLAQFEGSGISLAEQHRAWLG